MLRFIKHNLTGIDGVSIYPILSLLIFILFFTIMLIFVIKMNKTELETLSAIPLEEDDNLENDEE